MPEPQPRHRWHRRKRTWAGLAVVLALPPLYDLSAGPAMYGMLSGRLPGGVYEAVWRRPLGPVYRRLPGWAVQRFDGYLGWWAEFAYQ